MKVNIAVWDRVFRLFVGTLLVGWGIAGGPWWAFFGLVLIATGAWRFCPIYALLRAGTLETKTQRSPPKGQPRPKT